jgi:parallel beta-helix repeat protein
LKIKDLTIILLILLFILFIPYTKVSLCSSIPSYNIFYENFLLKSSIFFVGGNGSHNYSSIQDAIDNTTDGDKIFVYSGIYYENILINTSIFLIGENINTTIINGGYNDKFDTIYIHADGVFINGFTIQNCGNESNALYNGPDAGIDIRSNNNIITGNRIRNNLFGIYLYYSYNNNISNNLVSDNGVGIELDEGVTDSIIFKNLIISNNDGISTGSLFGNNHHNRIINNHISSNSIDGIYLASDSHNYKIFNNTINGNEYHGIFMITGSNSHMLIGNDIMHNGWGIRLFGINCNDSFISRNRIRNNYYGIWIQGSSNTNVLNNDIKDNIDIGLLITPISHDNKIVQNNFINNTPNCLFWITEKNHNNEWNENYWDRFRILPKPIFGVQSILSSVSPYIIIPRVVFDMNPAYNPFEM